MAHMSQGFYGGLVSVMMASVGDLWLLFMVASNIHHGSYMFHIGHKPGHPPVQRPHVLGLLSLSNQTFEP